MTSSASQSISPTTPRPTPPGSSSEELLDAADSLGVLGERGRLIYPGELPDIRELIVGSYRLVYRVLPDQLDVVAVFHTRQDYLRALGKRLG